MAAGDGVEQQLIQQLDALIEEGPDDELEAARGRRTLMDELLRKSPRVAPEGGGALLFNASPRIAPADGAAAGAELSTSMALPPALAGAFPPAGASPLLPLPAAPALELPSAPFELPLAPSCGLSLSSSPIAGVE